MNKKEKQKEDILRHGLALQRIFPSTKEMGPVALCKTLHRVESRLHRLAEKACNEGISDEASDTLEASTLDRLDSILGFKALGIPIVINWDPRGYSLKIESEYVKDKGLEIRRDWGGYGILSPEF